MLCEAVLVNTDYRSRIKHLMQPFEVVGVRDVTLVRYRLPKFHRKLRQEVTCRIISVPTFVFRQLPLASSKFDWKKGEAEKSTSVLSVLNINRYSNYMIHHIFIVYMIL